MVNKTKKLKGFQNNKIVGVGNNNIITYEINT